MGQVNDEERPTKATIGRLEEVNKELWVVLSLFVICLILNFLITSQRMVLSFYTLPTMFSAYMYGRRHATLTAFASVLLVALMTRYDTVLFAASGTPYCCKPFPIGASAISGGAMRRADPRQTSMEARPC